MAADTRLEVTMRTVSRSMDQLRALPERCAAIHATVRRRQISELMRRKAMQQHHRPGR